MIDFFELKDLVKLGFVDQECNKHVKKKLQSMYTKIDKFFTINLNLDAQINKFKSIQVFNNSNLIK